MRAFSLSRRSRSAGMATQPDGPPDIPPKVHVRTGSNPAVTYRSHIALKSVLLYTYKVIMKGNISTHEGSCIMPSLCFDKEVL